MDEELRSGLYQLIKYKFSGYPNVAALADDIVHDAYVALRSSKAFRQENENGDPFYFMDWIKMAN